MKKGCNPHGLQPFYFLKIYRLPSLNHFPLVTIEMTTKTIAAIENVSLSVARPRMRKAMPRIKDTLVIVRLLTFIRLSRPHFFEIRKIRIEKI